jgi:hypothetical protein
MQISADIQTRFDERSRKLRMLAPLVEQRLVPEYQPSLLQNLDCSVQGTVPWIGMNHDEIDSGHC